MRIFHEGKEIELCGSILPVGRVCMVMVVSELYAQYHGLVVEYWVRSGKETDGGQET